MKYIKYILLFTILLLPITYSNTSWIESINQENAEYRAKIVYAVMTILSHINKDDIQLWPFMVTRVIDWDTIEIDYFWEKEKIRVYWIDTPERIEPMYNEVNNYTKELLLWKNIYIKRIDKDRGSFGRLLREIYIDGNNYWDIMINKWYAEIY